MRCVDDECSMLTRLPSFACVAAALLATAMPAGANPVDHWISEGWSVLFEAQGDLNQDGLADVAFILEATEGETKPDNSCEGMDDWSEAEARRLIIAFDKGDGGHEISADEPRVALRRDQGGVFGDPLDSLSIENGSVVVRHYGGSRWRWGNALRFRFDEGTWRLIGMTDFWRDSFSGNNVEYDYNPLTGKMKRTTEIMEEVEGEPICNACLVGEDCPERNGCYTGTRPAKAGAEWFDIGIKPDIPLSDFTCWQEQTGLLRHLGFQDSR